ncbi:hypothetical protein LAX5112_04894 [Roseibium alexandrii]|uniref:Uncharacterized protein n=1 Tax=Roseibium alexandrii TaxID=388408 RepID=A0A0M7ASG3_9HYPH|nr:hypothetical protein LAX5112_04894 [Roseibium alexandrii]
MYPLELLRLLYVPALDQASWILGIAASALQRLRTAKKHRSTTAQCSDEDLQPVNENLQKRKDAA